ncbi:MAG: CotH kinase family protein, partial [Bacteroidota bacterium]
MWRPLLCLLAVGLADAVAAQPVLQIHEVVSNNATSALDEDGDASDWIEVANLGTEAVDLAGIALSDDPDRPRRWVFPSGTLAPGGIVLVFASGKDRASSVLHTSFRLRAEGETLTLTAADGQRLDTVDLPTLPADVSFGRDPAGDWVYFSPPTPGVLNGTGATRIASRPTLVPAPGRHDGPVEVVPEAGHPEEMLRYTRDGSIPTDTSPEVTGPIILSQNGLVRVRAFREGRLPGPVRTGTYLIGEPRDLPAVALAVDPVDLYSRASGVFNLFNLYQDLEAAAHLALIDAEADIPDLDANVGLRLHGGFSRRYPQKSVALFARERYGTEAITGALFPDRPREAYQAVVLRNSGQDWYFSMMRDGLMQTLVSGLDVDVQSYRPMAAYLNGAYWGLLNLRERTNEHYLAMRHGV